MGNPKEIVSVSVENVAFLLPPYKTDQKKTKHPVDRAGTGRDFVLRFPRIPGYPLP